MRRDKSDNWFLLAGKQRFGMGADAADEGGCCRGVRGGRRRVVGICWGLYAREAVAQSEIPEDSAVHACCVAAEAEEDEDHEAWCDGGPAVEEDGAVDGDHFDGVPFPVVDSAPGVVVPGEGEDYVVVNDVALEWEDAYEHW